MSLGTKIREEMIIHTSLGQMIPQPPIPSGPGGKTVEPPSPLLPDPWECPQEGSLKERGWGGCHPSLPSLARPAWDLQALTHAVLSLITQVMAWPLSVEAGNRVSTHALGALTARLTRCPTSHFLCTSSRLNPFMRNSLRSKPCEIEASLYTQTGLLPALPTRPPPNPGAWESRLEHGEGTWVPQRVTPKRCRVGDRLAPQRWLQVASTEVGLLQLQLRPDTHTAV